MKENTKAWQRWLPLAIGIVMALWALSALRERQPKTPFHVNDFAQLPVLLNGRIQPMDSVARNTLLTLRGKSTIKLSEKPEEELGFLEGMKAKKMSAIEWMLEAMTRPEDANTRRIFRVDNQEVLALVKLPEGRKYFSFNELKEGWQEIDKQASRLNQGLKDKSLKEELFTPFEKGVRKLAFSLNLYFQVQNSIGPATSKDFLGEINGFKEQIRPGLAALQKHESGQPYEESDLQVVIQYFKRYQMLSRAAHPFIIPPQAPNAARDNWTSIGATLMESIRGGQIPPAVISYATMSSAYAKNDPQEFNKALVEYRNYLQNSAARELTKGKKETAFNHYAPFVKSTAIYLMAFLFGCAYWFSFAEWTRKTAWLLLIVAFVVHTSGLLFRMHLEGRPPVTNLYSSAIFVGWGGALLGIILERFWRDAIGIVVAAALGVVTLIIAHNLSLGGDTMEMLRAVLDTNIWLATHVVVITLGYASMFVAGFLAIIYILRGVLTRSLSQPTSKALARMVYGIFCFATLFSFVGTILGGIWADQSWGRFWGWDPKENGALLIVIWCAVVLHARWGGLIRERGLMALAIFGNIVTSFSWFGVNMLGVGLHSYGFMDAAFKWLMLFNASQMVLIAMALLPLKYWRSFSQVVPEKKTGHEPGSGPASLPKPRPAGA
jgi:ABC-type transport system involved in cytochrome c biogenesis permease subunit